MPSRFELEDWFADFVKWLDHPEAGWQLSGGAPASFLLEVLSDASNELAACAVVAAHLRRYGKRVLRLDRPRADRLFWARSEWGKWDISYGLAIKRFESWTSAWHRSLTGDMGVIEAKVAYSHQSPSTHASMAADLRDQLEKRARWYTAARRADAPDYQTHGLVFLLDWGDHDRRAHWNQAFEDDASFTQTDWRQCQTPLSVSQMRDLWPRSDIERDAQLCLKLIRFDHVVGET